MAKIVRIKVTVGRLWHVFCFLSRRLDWRGGAEALTPAPSSFLTCRDPWVGEEKAQGPARATALYVSEPSIARCGQPPSSQAISTGGSIEQREVLC
jgi:hypothetical protein